MKLRTKYLLFVLILHLTTLVLTFLIFKENKILFILAEVFILISLYLSWELYKQLLQPLRMLLEGINAITDKDFNVKFLPTGKYEMDQLIHVYNNMIDSLRTERTLQEEQHLFLEKLINTSPTGVIVLDYDNNISQLNPRASEFLGLKNEALINKPVESIEHPVLKEISVLKTGESKIVSINGLESYKCQKSSFIDRGFPRYFIMIEELSAEILVAEKKAYGKVIRMMAHEVNNTIGPVNSIMNSALLIQQQQASHQELQHALQVAIERNNNLNIFMRNLADVVRLPAPDKKLLDINLLLISAGKLLELRAKEKGIEIEFHLSPEPLNLKADIQQLEQAIINIIKNAIDAIEPQTQGRIQIITEFSPPQLIIRDNGKGISEQVEANLFTPFFSTKKDGQGVGLTLIREILMNHRFDFSLKTSDNRFTDFSILFNPRKLK
ncbi:sensor histidine kinase [Rubrolithibacter danxiaensis]|uniref:sensor histidine kinase n=1 Tax=Rubrolithibacter danxiaensis TaxID=3390805 RepID=UPI003BF813F4